MATDTEIANAISRFVDKPHVIGNTSQGWDCLNTILDFYRQLGYEFPVEFEGITEENYAKKWKKDSLSCRLTLERFICSLGSPIEMSFAERGDLLILKTPNFPAFPAIYLGNGHILISLEEGEKVLPLRFFDKFITGVRRLI